LDEAFNEAGDVRAFAQAVVDTIREPFVVLNRDFHVLGASRSFYQTFQTCREDIHAKPFFALDDGQWNIPELRGLLEKVVPEHGFIDGFEVEHDFARIGQRIMLLNARKVFYEDDSHSTLMLGFEDITARRAIEREKAHLLKQTEDLLRQKETLLQEMQHRVANSLQIIASILMLKARSVTSEETRLHLRDAHQRVMSLASVQQHLQPSGHGEQIDVASYLSKLCETLAASMIGTTRPVALIVKADSGTAVSADAVSIGLIVTELAINALKHAFPDDATRGQVIVSYQINGNDWKLTVSDDGLGRQETGKRAIKGGLGTNLVKALAQQLDATVETVSGPKGTSVSIAHSVFIAKPLVALSA
jgi:two-component sensor histidine kinase